MCRFKVLWEWLLPDTEQVLVHGRAGLVIAACLALTAAVVALILTWIVSGDLQRETAVAGAVFILLLVGIGALARRGRVSLATWTLVILLTLVITTDVMPYGLGSPAAAAYVIPITLAACGLGLWAGIGVAVFGSVAAWLVAWATTAGWYEPWELVDISHLTFNAPALTVIFLIVALIVGVWTRYLGRAS